MPGFLCAAAILLSASPTAPKYQLRFSPGGPIHFQIHRVWKAIPVGAGNGTQTHDISIVLTSDAKTPRGLHLSITKFRGRSDERGDSGTTKHLAQISKEVAKLKLFRLFSSAGTIGPWGIDGYNDGGWAGMMTAKACGMYEVGPFELHLPTDPVSVGATWQSRVHLGNEGLEGKGMNWVKGNNPLCTYRLEAVNPRSSTAAISFSVATRVTGNFNNIMTRKPEAYSHTEKLSGRWTIDLKTGVPLTFKSDRKVVVAAQPSTRSPSETEITTTTATRRRA